MLTRRVGASLLGVVLITDPLRRAGRLGDDESALGGRALDDLLPTTILSKLLGMGICLGSVLCKSAESESKSFTLNHL